MNPACHPLEESSAALPAAIAQVSAGAWAVGVSGGADSVALLDLLCRRQERDAGLRLHVVHLDHQRRGAESDADAQFVRTLTESQGLSCTVETLAEVEAWERQNGRAAPPANPSARFRAARLALFRRTVAEHGLDAVVLAHHADDQAETILQRLLRGSGPAGLGGMSFRTEMGSGPARLTVLRPLLGMRSAALREWLRRVGQPWREDSSNQSTRYLRNRLRTALAKQPMVANSMCELGTACAAWQDWLRAHAPRLAESFHAAKLAALPRPLAEESARQWLRARGVPSDQVGPSSVSRLLLMASDLATATRQHFPGNLLVSRRLDVIRLELPNESTRPEGNCA